MSNDSAEGLDAARAGHSSRISINAILNATGSLSYYVAVVLITPLAIGYPCDKYSSYLIRCELFSK